MTGERIADYEIVQVLDRPGADRQLLARPPARLGSVAETVQVRVLPDLHDPDRLDRVVDDLKVFTGTASRHLVTLYDAGWDAGRLWFSMDNPPMGTLAEPGRFLSPEQRLEVMADAARGAHALHEAGLAHCDIRPATVLLDTDHAVLSAPELLRSIRPGRTVTGGVPIEDLEYADPALIRGEPPSRASDIWSLGLTLHRALALATAYPGLSTADGPLGAIRRVVSGGPEISTRLEPDAAELVRACIAPDPADRPTTALLLAELIGSL